MLDRRKMGLRRSGGVAAIALILLAGRAAVAHDAATEAIEVVAIDYAFASMPESFPPGASFRLRNAGEEEHEFLLLRRDVAAGPVEDLLSLPAPELFAGVRRVGALYAPPGQASTATLSVHEEGDYVALCLVPLAESLEVEPPSDPATSSAPPSPIVVPAGTSHALLGMVAGFTVRET